MNVITLEPASNPQLCFLSPEVVSSFGILDCRYETERSPENYYRLMYPGVQPCFHTASHDPKSQDQRWLENRI